ncbi:MAG: transglycosylase SLT domain-containing protein [Thermoproteota archaeon]|nr:transglycosylase SLT domain-containing protein [Thermoproteota archaeon]
MLTQLYSQITDPIILIILVRIPKYALGARHTESMIKPSRSDIFIIILLAIISLSLLLAIQPAIQIPSEEWLASSLNSAPRNLIVYQGSAMDQSDIIPISNSIASSNNCSTGWSVEGFFSESVVTTEAYPLVAGITSRTDTSIIPYGEIFTIPTLPSPWNNKTFIALDSEDDITGKHVNIYTGVGPAAENETMKIEGIENILCRDNEAPKENSTTTLNNISIGDPVYDQFDPYIINAGNHYGITDKMMVKSLIRQESHFDMFAVSSDIPCGVPPGWTDHESRSFGLTQVTPACLVGGGDRPNLTTDTKSPNWVDSWFNPEYNINQGVKSLSDNLSLMKSRFPGCSNEQYMSMALGAYNSGEGAIFGCGSWNERAGTYVASVDHHHIALSQIANILHAN